MGVSVVRWLMAGENCAMPPSKYFKYVLVVLEVLACFQVNEVVVADTNYTIPALKVLVD